MDIMNMFRTMVNPNGGTPQVPGQMPAGQQQPNGQQPANVRLDQQQQPANLQADPMNPQFGQPEPKQDKSPLEDFKDLWTIDPKQKSDAPESLSNFAFAVDQDKVSKSVQGMDFTKSLSPDLMQKIREGGEGAQVAMLQAMNIMARDVMKNSILVNAGIVEGGIKSSGAQVEKFLPGAVRKATISNTLREDNPLFSNPATAPMLSMLEAQLTTKFPNATTDEIRTHARNFISNFAKEAAALTGDQTAGNSGNSGGAGKKAPSLEDFSTW